MSEIDQLYQDIADAYEWLRDDSMEVYLSPHVVERLIFAARHHLQRLEREKGTP